MKPSRLWRSLPQRYRLEANRCASCGAVGIPPRLVCPDCGGREFEDYRLAETGRILTYTILHVAGDQFSNETPFAIGIIELDDGTRLTAQIVDVEPDDLATGQPVRMVFRKLQEDGDSGVIAYAYKAAPA